VVVWVAPDKTRAGRIEKAIGARRQRKTHLFRMTSSPRLLELLAGGAG